MKFRNSFGLRVPLSELVTHKEQETYQSISRYNRQRSISIFGNLAPGRDQGKVLVQAEEISRGLLPEGYQFAVEGASAGLAESFRSAAVAILMGIIVAYMILAIQFNSFIHPVSILAALPFSLTGALVVLWMTGSSLNLFSFIGLVVLMGSPRKIQFFSSSLRIMFAKKERAIPRRHCLKLVPCGCVRFL